MSTTAGTLRRLDKRTRRLCKRARHFEDAADPWLRGLVATAVYRDEPGLSVVRKRAEVLARTLERLVPVVLPEERIIGPAYRRFRVHQGVGDHDAWRIRVLNLERHGYNPDWPLPDHVRAELSWWKGRQVRMAPANQARQRHGWLMKYGIASPHGFVQGHTLPDHGILLDAGVTELRLRIAQRMETCPGRCKHDQWLAMDRCLQGVAALCRNSAAAARQRAGALDDADLAGRLLAAADACEHVASTPPQTLQQALQLLYFSNFADRMDNNGDASSYGRADQLLLPFYRHDVDAGHLDEEDAFDLVCHFLIKQWGMQDSCNITVGGQTPAGEDATNPLSWHFVDGMEATRLVTDMTVRLHRDTPPDFLRTVARVVSRGFGRPSLYNDEVAIPALNRHGVELEDARDYAPLGCVEVMIPGRSAFRTMCLGLNTTKVLELTLNGGRCLVSGDTVWQDVPTGFADYEAFQREYESRLRAVVGAAVEVIREDERIESRFFPRPWLSVLSRGGIEDGVDMTAGQPKYDPVGVTMNAIADTVNSLYVLKHETFRGDKGGLEELRRLLRSDWQGAAPLRQRVINRLPRFGEGEEAMRRIARREAARFADCFRGLRTFYGGPFLPMIFGLNTSNIYGRNSKTGATPSGRRAGDHLSMSLQPALDGSRGGITALLESVAAIDFTDYPGGVSNVQECSPQFFAGDGGLDRLVALLEGFFCMGGLELSLNCVGVDDLRAAREHPERYRHLTVRLFGLSAHFVDLTPDVQQDIIERAAAARVL